MSVMTINDTIPEPAPVQISNLPAGHGFKYNGDVYLKHDNGTSTNAVKLPAGAPMLLPVATLVRPVQLALTVSE